MAIASAQINRFGNAFCITSVWTALSNTSQAINSAIFRVQVTAAVAEAQVRLAAAAPKSGAISMI